MGNLVEYSYERAWNMINDISYISLSDEYLTIVVMQSYLLKKKEIIIEMLGYSDNALKFGRFEKPFIFKFLSILLPYYFILYNPNLGNIYSLANACHSFLMFEVLVLKNNKNNKNNSRIIDNILEKH